jgi:U3 small nucleolar ribonucleoprotein protein IMP4
MLITTSRKPGRKTRTFARVLSNFMNWRYFSRGKSSLKDFSDETVAIIEERGGNPSSLKIIKEGNEIFSIRFNVGNIKKIEMDSSPVVFLGKIPFDPGVLGGFSSNMKKNFNTNKTVHATRIGDRIILDFKYCGKSVFNIHLTSKENLK